MVANLFGLKQHNKIVINPLSVLAADPTACFDDAFIKQLRKNVPDFNWQQELSRQVRAANDGDLTASSIVIKAYDYFATVTDPATIDLITSMRLIAEANCSLGKPYTNR